MPSFELSSRSNSERNDISLAVNPTTPNHDDADTFELTGFKLLTVMVGLALAIFLMSLDSSIVATAIPHITSEFHSTNDTAWFGSAYSLSICALQPIAGKLFAKFSMKTMFLSFMLIFEVGSLVCATASNSNALIVGRAIAGAGAAGCFTGGFSIVATSVRLEKRSLYISILQSTFGIATILGPILGGALTQHATWRWCFYINLPIGAVTIFFLFFFFHPPVNETQSASTREKLSSLDFLGTAMLLPSIIMVLLALQWGGNDYAWNSATVIGLFVGAAALASIFILWQVRKGDDAMIPPRLLLQRTVLFACVAEFFAMGAVYIAIYYLPQWFQIIKDASATKSGLMYLPLSLTDIVAATLTGASLPFIGCPNPFVLAGTASLSIGSGLLSTLSPTSGHQYWIPYQVLQGLGAGMTLSMPYVSIQTVLKPEEIPVGTSLLQFFQFFGAAVFLAVGQAVFSNRFTSSLKVMGIASSEITKIVHAAPAQFREDIPSDQLTQVLAAYDRGVTGTFYVGAGLAAAACVASLGIQWKTVKVKSN